MYCRNCGKELPEGSRFCSNCGTPLEWKKKTTGKKRGTIILSILIVLVLLLGLSQILAMLHQDDSTATPTESPNRERVAATLPTTAKTPTLPPEPATQPPTETTVPLPEDGWNMENGVWYYYSDGEKVVDIQLIGGEYYYFCEDGALAVNADIKYGDLTLQADADGILQRVIIDELWGQWAEKKHYLGNGGTSGVLELNIPLEDCTSVTLCLEASGNRGAKVNGKWKFYVRSNGKWKFVQDLNFTQPNGSFDIEFDTPMSFDAITAYPTVQGNASYSSLYYLKNVNCPFRILVDD